LTERLPLSKYRSPPPSDRLAASKTQCLSNKAKIVVDLKVCLR
jgi:hypothetical protein